MRRLVGIAATVAFALPVAVVRAAPQDAERADAAPQDSFVSIEDGETLLVPVGTIEHAEIDENSGLVHVHGHWFTHNDSGDEARLFVAAGPDFGDAVPLPLLGAEAVDWEALTVLDGDLLACDVGDNLRSRSDLTVYRAAFVAQDDEAATPARLDLKATYPVAYPDGAHDCEAAFVVDGKLHLAVKNRGEPTTDVFRFDDLVDTRKLASGHRNVAVKVGSLEIPPREQITDVAIHAASGRVVFLTYSQLLVYPQGRLSGPPERHVTLHAQQCEALAFHGDDLYMTNEQREVYRFVRFLERDVAWALPGRPTYQVARLTDAAPGVDGMPTTDAPLTAIHLKRAGNDEQLRLGMTADQLIVDGSFAYAGKPIPTQQDSPRLGTSVLLLFPRGRTLQFEQEDLQIAVIVREDGEATVLNVGSGNARAELVPEARIRGKAEKGRLTFTLVLPLEYALGSPVPESFRFNAIGLGLGARPRPLVSGFNFFSVIRPFMAATIRRGPPSAVGKESDE